MIQFLKTKGFVRVFCKGLLPEQSQQRKYRTLLSSDSYRAWLQSGSHGQYLCWSSVELELRPKVNDGSSLFDTLRYFDFCPKEVFTIMEQFCNMAGIALKGQWDIFSIIFPPGVSLKEKQKFSDFVKNVFSFWNFRNINKGCFLDHIGLLRIFPWSDVNIFNVIGRF